MDMEKDIPQALYEIALSDEYIKGQVANITSAVMERLMQGRLVTVPYLKHTESMIYIVKCAKRIYNRTEGGQVNKLQRREAARLLSEYIFEKAQENINLKQRHIDDEKRYLL